MADHAAQASDKIGSSGIITGIIGLQPDPAFTFIRVGREPNLIPVHATYGVLSSLMLVIMSDAMIALIRELL